MSRLTVAAVAYTISAVVLTELMLVRRVVELDQRVEALEDLLTDRVLQRGVL